MNHDLQCSLIDRILSHIDARTTDAEDAASRLPVAAYTDPDRLTNEIDALFHGSPIIAAHASQLANPGDYVTQDICGVPIVVCRDDDGNLGAFLNVCRHRGTAVVGSPCGNARRFTCPYHAWTYGTDGSLRGVPHKHGFPTLDTASSGLVRLPVAERAGFVFVRARPGRDIDADALLPGIEPDLVGFGLDTSSCYSTRVLAKDLNWKLGIDIFLETYHLRQTHAKSIYPMFFDNIGLVNAYPPHLRVVIPKRSVTGLVSMNRTDWRLRDHANILYYLFPNTLILVQPDHAAMLNLFPRGLDRCELRSTTLVPSRPTTEKARSYWNANNDILYAATAEDFERGESIQRCLASGAIEAVTFANYEHALRQFHSAIERAISAGRTSSNEG